MIQISHDLLLDRRKMPKAFLADEFTSVGFRYRLFCFPVERLKNCCSSYSSGMLEFVWELDE
jgi:hypothetical protein